MIEQLIYASTNSDAGYASTVTVNVVALFAQFSALNTVILRVSYRSRRRGLAGPKKVQEKALECKTAKNEKKQKINFRKN